jgi:hypothetical protein
MSSAHLDEAEAAAANGGPRVYTAADFDLDTLSQYAALRRATSAAPESTPNELDRARKLEQIRAYAERFTPGEGEQAERSRQAMVESLSKPYEVLWGRMHKNWAKFETFGESLEFYRMLKSEAERAVVNTDRMEGSEDGNPSGLTEDEREMVREA